MPLLTSVLELEKPVVCTNPVMGIRLQNKTWENSHYTIEPNLDFYLKSVSLYLFSRIMIIKGFLGFREKLTLFALEGNETNTSMGDVKFP